MFDAANEKFFCSVAFVNRAAIQRLAAVKASPSWWGQVLEQLKNERIEILFRIICLARLFERALPTNLSVAIFIGKLQRRDCSSSGLAHTYRSVSVLEVQPLHSYRSVSVALARTVQRCSNRQAILTVASVSFPPLSIKRYNTSVVVAQMS